MKKLKTFFIMGAPILLFSTFAIAQKLPSVQPSTGFRAPANVKIDGKTTEWDNTFQAYNHATETFYTIANDDDHLYLIVKADLFDVINKIMGGGITFTIQRSGKKNDKGSIAITYPLFDKENRPSFNTSMSIAVRDGVTKTTSTPPLMTDSAINARNKQLTDKSKLIGVTGIPTLDTLISVYNTDGIKTAALLNSKGEYVYELAIDLKLLGLSVADAPKFAYHITLNGINLFANTVTNVKVMGGGSAPSSAAIENVKADIMAKLNAMTGNISAATDFWGEYTLAKK